MGMENARAHLRSFDLEDRILEFEVSSATVELAAQAVGVPPAHIAKTLSFKVADSPILVVVAGDARVDNVKYKNQFKVKAKMLTPEEVHNHVGHGVGGVCPFGVHSEVTVYLDESLKRFKEVYPACGTASSAVRLEIAELERCSNYSQWIDVCKDWV